MLDDRPLMHGNFSITRMALPKMAFSVLAVVLLAFLPDAPAFVVPPTTTRTHRHVGAMLYATTSTTTTLFQDEEEIIPICQNYVRAKYRQVVANNSKDAHNDDNDNTVMNKDDARQVLRTLLPPVTPDELEEEVTKTLQGAGDDSISEDAFVNAVLKNKYWQEAGDLVVKELIYFDTLYNYYHPKNKQDTAATPLLNDDDYAEIKQNLEWEGSSVPRMNAKEALFVTAVASARRGDSIMSDVDYMQLKKDLKDSWVTQRSPDALEKLGVETFLGYLHQAMDKQK